MAKLKTGRHTSAIKAQRQAERRTVRNRTQKKKARELTKDFLSAVSSKKGDEAKKLLRTACSAWDKAAAKGAIHRQTAARHKSRLAVRLDKALAPA